MMSGKYKTQFDSKAGRPADFDSLFGFQGDDIYAKRRIRPSKKRRARAVAAVVSIAAAAFICIAGLPYVSRLGNESGIAEMAAPDISEGVAEITDNDIMSGVDNRSVPKITESSFRYSLLKRRETDEYTFDKAFSNADFAAVCTVLGKSIDYGIVSYKVKIRSTISDNVADQSYYYNDYEYSIIIDDSVELYVGEQYLLPMIDAEQETDESCYIFCLSAFYTRPIVLSDDMWTVPSCYADLFHGERHGYFSDITVDKASMTDYLYDYFGKGAELIELQDYRSYYSHIYDFFSVRTDNGSVLINEFEDLSYVNNEHTIIAVENKDYHNLVPSITGICTYAGKTDDGNDIIVLDVSDSSTVADTVMFMGQMELFIREGETVSGNSIAFSNADRLYITAIGKNGLPVRFGIESDSFVRDLDLVVFATDVYHYQNENIWSITVRLKQGNISIDELYLNNSFSVEKFNSATGEYEQKILMPINSEYNSFYYFNDPDAYYDDSGYKDYYLPLIIKQDESESLENGDYRIRLTIPITGDICAYFRLPDDIEP